MIEAEATAVIGAGDPAVESSAVHAIISRTGDWAPVAFVIDDIAGVGDYRGIRTIDLSIS